MLNNDSTAYGAQETMTIPNSETSQSPASIPTAGDYYCNLFPGLNRFKENVSVRCIFHQDNSPSLSLNLRNGTFNCFGCKTKGGSIVQFHAIRQGLTYTEAAAVLRKEGFDISRTTVDRKLPEPAEWEQRLWLYGLQAEGRPAQDGGLIHRYFTETRRIPLKHVPPNLVLHPSLDYVDDTGRIIGSFPVRNHAKLPKLNHEKLPLDRGG